MEMRAGNIVLEKSGINPDLKEKISEYSLERDRQEIESDIKNRGFGYQAWTKTHYVSEKDHKEHIHVTVDVAGARSEVVLVRDGDSLKISPNPSLYRNR